MKFRYFIYTNGESVAKSKDWGVKFISPGFPPADIDGGKAEDYSPTALNNAWKEKIELADSHLSTSLQWQNDYFHYWNDQDGYLLMPWSESHCLAGVYSKFSDHFGRPNISLVMAAVPLDVMACMSAVYFLARLQKDNPLREIARPRLSVDDNPTSDHIRPPFLFIEEQKSDVTLDSSLKALQDEDIDWRHLNQLVIAVKGAVSLFGSFPAPKVPSPIEVPKPQPITVTPAPEIPHADKTPMTSPTNASAVPQLKIYHSSAVSQGSSATDSPAEEFTVKYFVLNNGERTPGFSQGGEDWAIKFASPGFPLKSGGSYSLKDLNREYRSLIESYEGGSLGLTEKEDGRYIYWNSKNDGYGYILIPWNESCYLAGIYSQFHDHVKRPNISLVVTAVDSKIQKIMMPDRFFGALCADNPIRDIARPRLEKEIENKSFMDRPETLRVSTQKMNSATDDSLLSLRGIEWADVTKPYIAVNGRLFPFHKLAKTEINCTPVWSTNPQSVVPSKRGKLWASVAALVLFVVASGTVFTMYRSKVRLEGELAVAQQNLAVKEKEISKLQDTLESQAKVLFAKEQEISELKRKNEEKQKKKEKKFSKLQDTLKSQAKVLFAKGQEISELKRKNEEKQKKAEAQEKQIDVLQQQPDALTAKSSDGENSVEVPEPGKM